MTDVTPPQFAGIDESFPDEVFNPDQFYPSLSLSGFCSKMRIVERNSDPVLAALQSAISEVNHELRNWKTAQVNAGISTLAEELVSKYETAVFSNAKAQLNEMYRTVDTTKSGHARADALDTEVFGYYLKARKYTNMIQGIPTITAALL